MDHQLLCYESITPHLKTLRAFGFYHIETENPRWKRYLHKILMAVVLFYGIIYTIQQMLKINEVLDDIDKVIETMFLMLTYSSALYKEILLWKEEHKIEQLLEILKGPLFNQNESEHRSLLMDRARQSKILLRAFNMAALSTCVLWAVYPTIRYVQSKPVEFTIWLPYDPNMTPHFYFTLVYNFIQTSLLAIGNTSMDAFITCFYAQCKTQISILRVDLKNIIEKCELESKITSESLAVIFNRRFRKIIMHYNEIVNVCQKTQNVFGGATLFLFLIGCWVLCTSAYAMTHVNPVSVQFSSILMYLFCILTELNLYCYYGNEVSYESQYLMESVFSMDWYKVPLQERYSIILFMERLKRCIVPMAGNFVPLSNNTFISILRSSYSFYAFLKNSGE